MASIKERRGSYEITVSLGRDTNGKKIIETTTYRPVSTTPKKIEKEVSDFAYEFEKQVREGKYLSGEKISFASFVDLWRENWLPQKTERIRDEYNRKIEKHFIPVIGHMKLSKIKATHIDTVLNGLKKAGKAPATVRNTYTAINSVMRYAFKKGLIEENPCTRCDDLPSVKRDPDLHYFTLEQAKTFLAALDREYSFKFTAHKRYLKKSGIIYEVPEYVESHAIPLQFKAYFMLAIYGGFRRGEIVALKWSDIDYEKKSVSIRKSATKTFDGLKIKEPKTESSNRDVMLPDDCFKILRKWQDEQRRLALKLGSAWKGKRGKDFDQNFIFIRTDTGEMMDVDTPTHKFREIIDLYNSTCEREEDRLPYIRLHDLRHTSATLLLAQNTDIATVSHRLGHSKISTTLDVYTHALKSKDEEASNILDMLFNEAK